MSQYTREDLKEMQSWPLDKKIAVSKTRIVEWYQHWDGKVYVSFSGGKDSTVLLYLVRSLYPDVPAVFCDTGLEYPEIRSFVRMFRNVEWIYPVEYDRHKREYVRCSFRSVIEKYGYPVVSKQVSNVIQGARHNPDSVRGQRIRGELADSQGRPGKSQFNCSNWQFLMDAPFIISDKCCQIMKKNPAMVYDKKSGRKPILGLMAEESNKRAMDYMKTGCNAFSKGKPQSQPLGFWTEQDVLQFLNIYHDDMLAAIKTDEAVQGISQEDIDSLKHPWASVYGDLIKNENGALAFSAEDRTGCMFCMYGCHMEGRPTRFERMKITHPKQYEYCMKSREQGGLGLHEILTYVGVDH